MIIADDKLIAAFRPEWERLGVVAARLGFRHGNMVIQQARGLRDRGLVETKFNGMCLSWRLSDASAAVAGERGPAYRYDPPEETEGPHAGLVRAFAERLWRKRTGQPDADWSNASPQTRLSWIAAAEDALAFLFEVGFVGPAGEPDPARFEGRNYAWLDSGCGWEIVDSAGGFVALVSESTDLELLLAAPAMRAAIRALLEPLPANHSLRSNPQIAALEAALPENRSKREKNNADV